MRPRGTNQPAPNIGAIRVIAGEHGGRRLDTPGGEISRPTADRVREAIFNALESRGGVEGLQILDAFAGSGGLGIEALSRGADRVFFAETSPAAIDVIETNLRNLGLERRAEVRRADARRILPTGRWDLILLDPPYGWDEWEELLTVAAEHLEPDGLVAIETDDDVPVPPALDVLRSRRYGSTVVTFLIHTGADE